MGVPYSPAPATWPVCCRMATAAVRQRPSATGMARIQCGARLGRDREQFKVSDTAARTDVAMATPRLRTAPAGDRCSARIRATGNRLSFHVLTSAKTGGAVCPSAKSALPRIFINRSNSVLPNSWPARKNVPAAPADIAVAMGNCKARPKWARPATTVPLG